jgi:hypothetical protein
MNNIIDTINSLNGQSCMSSSLDSYRPSALSFDAEVFDSERFLHLYDLEEDIVTISEGNGTLIISVCNNDTRSFIDTYIFTR